MKYANALIAISPLIFCRGVVSLMRMNSAHGTTVISKKSVSGADNVGKGLPDMWKKEKSTTLISTRYTMNRNIIFCRSLRCPL